MPASFARRAIPYLFRIYPVSIPHPSRIHPVSAAVPPAPGTFPHYAAKHVKRRRAASGGRSTLRWPIVRVRCPAGPAASGLGTTLFMEWRSTNGTQAVCRFRHASPRAGVRRAPGAGRAWRRAGRCVRAAWLPAIAAGCLALAGCSSAPRPAYPETFKDTNTYSRAYPATNAATCEAARRALLSQGYTIGKAQTDGVEGQKNFPGQDDGKQHQVISSRGLHVGSPGTAEYHRVRERGAGSVHHQEDHQFGGRGAGACWDRCRCRSGPTDDSLAKVSSETISTPSFYDGFFELLQALFAAERIEGAVRRKPLEDGMAQKTERQCGWKRRRRTRTRRRRRQPFFPVAQASDDHAPCHAGRASAKSPAFFFFFSMSAQPTANSPPPLQPSPRRPGWPPPRPRRPARRRRAPDGPAKPADSGARRRACRSLSLDANLHAKLYSPP